MPIWIDQSSSSDTTHNLAALRQELRDRGFSYLSDARIDWILNAAYTELNELELWPWRDTTATGASPLSIADLGIVGSVVDTDAQHTLTPIDRRQLFNDVADIATSGTPTFFYLTDGTVNTYPVGGTLSVRYFASTPTLIAATDVPIVPSRFVPTIIDIGVRRAYLDDENYASVPGIQTEIDRQLDLMREAFLWNTAGRPLTISDIAISGDW